MSEKLNFSGEEIEPVSRRAIGVKVLSLYAAKERDRVEKIKTDLEEGRGLEYEQKQISTQPSFLRKVARLAGDAININPKKDEKRREGEAIHIALTERKEEEEAKTRALQEEDRQRAAQLEEDRRKREIEQAAREKEQLERDMANAQGFFDHHKRDRLRKQRVQEIIERDLNKRLLNIDDLDNEVLAENPEINKRSVSFGETEIPVYDLKGLPFSVLSTTIDYRSVNKDNPNHIGAITYQNVMDSPEIWVQRRDEAEKSSGFGTRNGNARGDTISASYWNSEKNISSHVRGELIYGFSKVEADSIIYIINKDGGTSNMAGRDETLLRNPNDIDNLESADGVCSYNEILLRRYSEENGAPKKPDYIITEDNKISEVALRHAAFYNIPIININRSSYFEKALKRGEKLIESISEKDSYEELEKKISELLSMSQFKGHFQDLKEIGRRCDIKYLSPWADDFQKKSLEISKMEQLKRLDFIKDILISETQKINAETEKGLLAPEKPSQFEYFRVYIDDLQKVTHSDGDFDDDGFAWFLSPGSCNQINIDFRLKGNSRRHETNIYDGENIYQFDKTEMTDEDLKQADSSYYKTLEPIVRAYIDARRNNRSRLTPQVQHLS